MKKHLFIYLSLSLFTGLAYGQTGVGTRNPKGRLHVDGAKDNPLDNSTPSATQAANDVIVDATTGFIGVGVLAPRVPLDMRSNGTQNALGIGFTTMTAAAAAAGAIRYDETDPTDLPVGPKIQVSDGAVWHRIYMGPQKAVVVARKITTQLIASGGTPANLIDWDEVRDMSNSFVPATGVFTAPRDGTYTFLLTFNFNSTVITDASYVLTQFYNTATNTILAQSYKTFGQSMTGSSNDGATRSSQAGGSSTITLTLLAGQTIVPRLYQNISTGSVNLRVRSTTDPADPNAGFNNLTIIEH